MIYEIFLIIVLLITNLVTLALALFLLAIHVTLFAVVIQLMIWIWAGDNWWKMNNFWEKEFWIKK